ncbi:MAG: trypsin-like serine protease [Planctomycetota bacterium]
MGTSIQAKPIILADLRLIRWLLFNLMSSSRYSVVCVSWLGSVMLCLVLSKDASGLSIRDDVDRLPYETLADSAPYSLSGTFTNSMGGKSGTLVATDWVLTAAHNGNRAGFTLNGQTSSIVQREVYSLDPSELNASDGFDFALLRLGTPIAPPTDLPAFYSGDLADLQGDPVVMTGSGFVGTGDVGEGSDRARLAGTNRISQVGGTIGTTTYANNIAFMSFSSAPPFTTSLEAGLTDGDSGGGLWVSDPVAGLQLGGVHSFVLKRSFDPLGLYGQTSASTLLTSNAIAWIESIIDPDVMAGDFNEDGFVTIADIDGFLNAIAASVQTSLEIAYGDFNGDDLVTIADVDGFLSTLAGPLTGDEFASFQAVGYAIPEPSSAAWMLGLAWLIGARGSRSCQRGWSA